MDRVGGVRVGGGLGKRVTLPGAARLDVDHRFPFRRDIAARDRSPLGRNCNTRGTEETGGPIPAIRGVGDVH